MLQDKDIKNVSELKQTFVSKHKKLEFFTNLIDILKVGKYHAIFSSAKQKGDRKSTRLNSSHIPLSRMPSSA